MLTSDSFIYFLGHLCNKERVYTFVALFVLSLCPDDISVGVWAFVIGLSQISSFFSYELFPVSLKLISTFLQDMIGWIGLDRIKFYPASYIQHSASYIQHPTSSIQHPTSNNQHPTSYIQHPTSYPIPKSVKVFSSRTVRQSVQRKSANNCISNIQSYKRGITQNSKL